MVRSGFTSLILSAVCVLALGACSSNNDKLDAMTGWLGPLAQFTRVSGDGNRGVFLGPATTPAAPVETLYIPPVDVTLSPQSALEALLPAEFEEIRGLLDRRVRELLAKEFKIVSGPGPDAYTLRVALTNLVVKRVGNTARARSRDDLRFGFGVAAIESEIRDGTTNGRRAVTAAPLATAQNRLATADVTWTGLPAQLDRFAAALAEQIAAARTALAAEPAARDAPPQKP